MKYGLNYFFGCRLYTTKILSFKILFCKIKQVENNEYIFFFTLKAQIQERNLKLKIGFHVFNHFYETLYFTLFIVVIFIPELAQ